MAAKSKKKTALPCTQACRGNPPPFHFAARRARESSYTHVSALAAPTGLTVAHVRAMEDGKVPCTRSMYDAYVAQYPLLAKYPPPPPDPCPNPPRVPAAVQFELDRQAPHLELAKKLNPNRHNREAVREIIKRVRDGLWTEDDDRFV